MNLNKNNQQFNNIQTRYEKGNENYNPYEHRNPPKPTNDFETLVHLVKACMGTGLLALPSAFAKAGWLSAIISTVLIGALSVYCLHILVKCQYYLCKRNQCATINYPETVKLALEIGPKSLRWLVPIAPWAVNFFITVYQLGTGCVYIIFVATNLKQIGDIYINHHSDSQTLLFINNNNISTVSDAFDGDDKEDKLIINLSSNNNSSVEMMSSEQVGLSLQTYFLIVLLPFILINLIRSLKILAPFSTLANLFQFIGILIIFFYLFQQTPDFVNQKMVGTFKDYIFYFGTTIFAFGVSPTVCTLEENMKTPENFTKPCGVINIGMLLISTIYLIMGLFGFLRYGEQVPDTITLILPSEKEILAQLGVIMFTISIYLTSGIQYFISIDLMWRSNRIQTMIEKSNYKILFEYLFRICIVLITYILAYTIPEIGLFISLFGCLCLSALSLALPALCELCIYWNDDDEKEQRNSRQLLFAKDILIIIFGTIALILGTYTNLIKIIDKIF